MGYTQVALEDKVLAMYPEITKHGISLGLSFDAARNAWIVKLRKGANELTTHLEKKRCR